jgi:7-keto-8-aminopelargonate synthetase-like enzyme
LSKAFGCYGGVVLAPSEICKDIATKSAVMTGATPFPLSHAAGCIAAAGVLKEAGSRVALRENLRRLGIESDVPIHARFSVDENEQLALVKALLARGIFPTSIRYHNGPPQGFLRFAISSEHSRAQLDALADALQS